MDGEAVYDGTGTYVSGPDEAYRVPDTLAATPFALRNVLIVGSCFGEALGPHIANMMPGANADVILFNHAAALPPAPPRPLAAYDCQVVLLPLREMMHEHRMMRLPGDDAAGYEAAFAQYAAPLSSPMPICWPETCTRVRGSAPARLVSCSSGARSTGRAIA